MPHHFPRKFATFIKLFYSPKRNLDVISKIAYRLSSHVFWGGGSVGGWSVAPSVLALHNFPIKNFDLDLNFNRSHVMFHPHYIRHDGGCKTLDSIIKI